MRCLELFPTILPAILIAATVAPVLAQEPPAGRATSPGGNVSAVGRKMPPATGRMPAGSETGTPGPKAADAKAADKPKTSTEAEMLKAQKAAEERNKAWDGKMRKTMGSICSGC